MIKWNTAEKECVTHKQVEFQCKEEVPKNQKLDQGHKLIKEEKGGGTYT